MMMLGPTAKDRNDRVAIVDADRCKPTKCGRECMKACPVNATGSECVEVAPPATARISEALCVGCNLCVKKCPFKAIRIVHVPTPVRRHGILHKYGLNSFQLQGTMAMPRRGQVLGLVGSNGTGKSTVLKVLGGLKPNLGRLANGPPPTWEEVLAHFRGSELQAYLTRVVEGGMVTAHKPQHIEGVRKVVTGNVGAALDGADARGAMARLATALDLDQVRDRDVGDLSGGELQRLAIAMTAARAAHVYMFDEPSSYLDVRQRLRAAAVIRGLAGGVPPGGGPPGRPQGGPPEPQEEERQSYVVAVEHDLAVLDYMSDFVCCLYGVPGAFGVVTAPFGVREGINVFLRGEVPHEAMRFREEGLSFRRGERGPEELAQAGARHAQYGYPAMTRTQGGFALTVEPGAYTDSEVLVLLGENGTGKTTFLRLLAGGLEPDEAADAVPRLAVSHKPQAIGRPRFQGAVAQLLRAKVGPRRLQDPQFRTDVLRPLALEALMDREVQELSGGELQRVALALCLGQEADVYLIDEPSAFLDSEQRLAAAKVIRRFALHARKTAFVVEHDLMMAAYMADRAVVFDGSPSRRATARAPQALEAGMNAFLQGMGVTLRRDAETHRPRVNKPGSVKDTEQKRAGVYYYV